MSSSSLPIVIIGAGPVGLAAAAHVVSRRLTPLVFEAGSGVGAGIQRWAHVRMFSPWRFNVDRVAVDLLSRQGWVQPNGEDFPTGLEFVARYLEPLATVPELAGHIRLNSRVIAVSRQDHDLMKDAGREVTPFLVRVAGEQGEYDVLARALIDASGTIDSPGVLGASGLPARGERAAAGRIFYGIPDVLRAHRRRYAGRRVLVVGSGHSAANALLDLAQLSEAHEDTRVIWVIRRESIGAWLGGAGNDELEERGRIGTRVRARLDAGRFELVTGFQLDAVTSTAEGLIVSAGPRMLGPVDEIIAATGFRPDWSILSELRLDLDAAVQSPRALAPLIDPNLHSCGTVRPHGAGELKHPDPDLYAIGMKSYGRAPTFLMLTGYEQARSVVAEIAGDADAARRVELVLPDTGVCATDRRDGGAGGCCGTPAVAAAAVVVGEPGAAPQTAGGCC